MHKRLGCTKHFARNIVVQLHGLARVIQLSSPLNRPIPNRAIRFPIFHLSRPASQSNIKLFNTEQKEKGISVTLGNISPSESKHKSGYEPYHGLAVLVAEL